jgi:hypothetical protein
LISIGFFLVNGLTLSVSINGCVDAYAKTKVTAEDEHWPPAGIAQSDKEALNSCAHLRQNMASQGLNEAAHFFFRREMTHKAKLSEWWERPFYAI